VRTCLNRAVAVRLQPANGIFLSAQYPDNELWDGISAWISSESPRALPIPADCIPAINACLITQREAETFRRHSDTNFLIAGICGGEVKDYGGIGGR